jgi:hypothetical protein
MKEAGAVGTKNEEQKNTHKEMKMSQVERQSELREKTRQLLQGPLKHARVVALAASLLPVAAVPASAAVDQPCGSAGNFCGFVWNDLDGDGVQDAGEPGIGGAVVLVDGEPAGATFPNGYYEILVSTGDHVIAVVMPPSTVPSPIDQGGNDATDSDGVPNGIYSEALVNVSDQVQFTVNTDFGFVVVANAVGTGTPGYWMNHPEAWPVPVIEIGGVPYTQAQAIALLQAPGNKDKTYTMFASLVSAKLNLLNGTNPVCITDEIAAADTWMATYGPVGSKVAASSYAWRVGEPHHRAMDDYNNGGLCAPHRD